MRIQWREGPAKSPDRELLLWWCLKHERDCESLYLEAVAGRYPDGFSWGLKEENKWARWKRGWFQEERSVYIPDLCNKNSRETFSGQEEGKSGWNWVQEGDFNWEPRITREMSHSQPCYKTNMTTQGTGCNGPATCRESYFLGHLLINGQVAISGQKLCTGQCVCGVVKLSPNTQEILSDLSKLFTNSTLSAKCNKEQSLLLLPSKKRPS